MKTLAAIFGTLGGLCTVMGIVVAVKVIPEYAGLTWVFWFVLAAILFLITIAFNVSRGGND
jgi:uncharacterized integral membrane protein